MQPNFGGIVSGIPNNQPRWPPQPNLVKQETMGNHLKIFSETTEPIPTKLNWNDLFMVL